MILTWWQWLLIALGIVFIFFLILVPVLMIWRCCKDIEKEDKNPNVEEEKDKENLKLENIYV